MEDLWDWVKTIAVCLGLGFTVAAVAGSLMMATVTQMFIGGLAIGAFALAAFVLTIRG